MRSIALYSGGKDSTYSVYLAMQQGHEIERLVVIYPKNRESYMYHIPMIDRTRYQAEAMGIPRDVYHIGDSMEELRGVLENYDVDAVVSGAIASNYQKTKIEEVCTDLGLISYAPLWGKDQEMILRDMLQAGMKIMILGVYAYGLDETYLGRVIDEEVLESLKKLEEKYRINISGEGGEYETFVLDAPFFSKRIEVRDIVTRWNGIRGEIVDMRIELRQK